MLYNQCGIVLVGDNVNYAIIWRGQFQSIGDESLRLFRERLCLCRTLDSRANDLGFETCPWNMPKHEKILVSITWPGWGLDGNQRNTIIGNFGVLKLTMFGLWESLGESNSLKVLHLMIWNVPHLLNREPIMELWCISLYPMGKGYMGSLMTSCTQEQLQPIKYFPHFTTL